MIISLDTETALIETGKLAPELACVSFVVENNTGLLHWTDKEAIQHLLESVELLIGANTAYDTTVIMTQYPEFMELIFNLYRDKKVVDVQLSEKLIDIARGILGGFRNHKGFYKKKSYSVDALHQHYGYQELDKHTHRLLYGEYRKDPLEKWSEGAKKYAVDDAIAHLRIYEGQREFSDYLEDELNQPGPAFALHLMSCQGIRTDPEELTLVTQEVEQEIEDARKICEKAGLVIKGKRKQQPAKDLLLEIYEAHGFEVPLTDTGIEKSGGTEFMHAKEIRIECLEKYVKTDETACVTSGDERLIAYSTYGSANTVRTKLETLAKGVHTPLQTRFDPLLNTGRTSSSKPGEPLIGDNFQNMARDGRTRRCIIPSPGYYLCSVDFNMMELVCWAQVCHWAIGQSRMREVLNAGMDPHLDFACQWLLPEKIHYDEGKKRKDQGDPDIKMGRQIAKGANFGLPGGLGVATFHKFLMASEVRVSKDTAAKARFGWFQQWPEAEPYFAWVKEKLGLGGIGTAVQFVSGRVRGLCPFSTLANTYFQGLAADAAKSTLLPLARECYLESENSILFNSRPLLFIHDEVLGEVPIECASQAAFRMRDVMIEHASKYVPDVKLTATPALMTRWIKSAEAEYDSEGNLIPWDSVMDYDRAKCKYTRKVMELAA